MASTRYNPDRDITPHYLNTVRRWIDETGEVLVIMRYLCGGGAKDYALIHSRQEFDHLVDVCREGTDIIVFRDKQLPLRGTVDRDFIESALQFLPPESEYLFMLTTPERPGDPRCSGGFDDRRSLVEDLEDVMGEHVALGFCPDFIAPDNESMISAAKGGIDGPR